MSTSSQRRVAVLASTVLTAGAVTLAMAPTAHAAPVFVDASTSLSTQSVLKTDTGACVTTPTASAPVSGTVAENGAATTQSTQGTASAVNAAVADATLATSGSGTASIKSANGNPTTIDLTTSGSAKVDTVPATSGCIYNAYTQSDLKFRFTTTQPGILHLDMAGSQGAFSSVTLTQDDPAAADDPFYNHNGYGSRFNASDDVVLPAGVWYGTLTGKTSALSNHDVAKTSTTGIHATFHVIGTLTAPVSGAGSKYVTLPGSRSCSTNTVDATITPRKRAAKQIKQVTFLVNDKKVSVVKTPKQGASVKLPVTATSSADVTALVKLFPKRKGKPAKVVGVDASYAACS